MQGDETTRVWPDHFEHPLFSLLAGSSDPRQLERWVYADATLEARLSPDHYLELISLDYRGRESLYQARKIIQPYVDMGRFQHWVLVLMLQTILKRPADVHRAIAQSYDLYCDGYTFLEDLGLGYGLTIVCPPSASHWDALTPLEQATLIDCCYPGVAVAAAEVLRWLETGGIVILPSVDHWRSARYADRRPIPDRFPSHAKPRPRTV